MYFKERPGREREGGGSYLKEMSGRRNFPNKASGGY